MKTHACSARPWYLVLSLLALSRVQPAVAQDANLFPTVTIYATDAHASETGPDPGTLTVKRSGSTNFPLAVFFHLSGTGLRDLRLRPRRAQQRRRGHRGQ